jgi:RNA polymerase sigma-70 factor (ECF subfamily)
MISVDTESTSYQQATDHRTRPDELAEGADFQSTLQTAIANLPEPHRSIVVYREVHEFKYDEIADILKLPLNTVKVYLHRARRMLRDELRNRLDYVPEK